MAGSSTVDKATSEEVAEATAKVEPTSARALGIDLAPGVRKGVVRSMVGVAGLWLAKSYALGGILYEIDIFLLVAFSMLGGVWIASWSKIWAPKEARKKG